MTRVCKINRGKVHRQDADKPFQEAKGVVMIHHSTSSLEFQRCDRNSRTAKLISMTYETYRAHEEYTSNKVHRQQK